MTRPSRHRRLLCAVAAVVSATAAAVVVPATAPAAARTPGPYVAVRPACARPADPSAIRCFAEKLVQVAPDSPGAVPQKSVAVGHGRGGGLSPWDLARAYGYNRNGGSGQTVGIIMWGHNPYVAQDLATFERTYRLGRETASSFKIVNEHGRSRPLPSADNSLTGTHGEIDLDVQTVRSVCAKCRILLVEAAVEDDGVPSDTSMANAVRTAVRMGATVVSNSWGGPESQYRTDGVLPRAFNQPGVVITASTGDNGWYGWDYAQSGDTSDGSASFPASSPNVVSVGGTSLSLNPNGSVARETVWNGDGGSADRLAGGASGGGCSRLWTAPLWQRTMPGYSAAGCHNDRLTADVAADADPATGLSIVSRSEGGWGVYGGTSLAAPIISGLYALAGGAGGSAYPAASLYVNAQHGHAASRYDVTSGGTGFCGADLPATCAQSVLARSGQRTNNPNVFYGETVDCSFASSGRSVAAASSRECTAAAGFDGPTGVGTPRGLGLFGNTAPAAGISGTRTVRAGHSGTWTASVAPKAGAKLGTINWYFGDGTARSGTRVTHTWSRKGSHEVGYRVTDSYGQLVIRHLTVKVT